MRQTNVCSNRVFKVYVKFVYRELAQTFMLAKKVCDENRKRKKERQKKRRALYTW